MVKGKLIVVRKHKYVNSNLPKYSKYPARVYSEFDFQHFQRVHRLLEERRPETCDRHLLQEYGRLIVGRSVNYVFGQTSRS